MFVPVVSFFAAYGVSVICSLAVSQATTKFNLNENKANITITMSCLTLLLACTIFNTISYKPKAYFDRNDFFLAKIIRENFPSETIIWTWWDYGYFFKYLTGNDVYFDGGSQSEVTCFTAAYPLVQENTKVAAAWIKNYTLPPANRLDIDKNQKETWAERLSAFNETLVNSPSQPHRPVALCLPARVYTTTGFLYSFAHIFDRKPHPVINHLDLYSKTQFYYDAKSNTVQLPEYVVEKGYNSFGGVIDATGKSINDFNFDTIHDPYLLFSQNTDFLAITDRAMVKSVLFRLLGIFEDNNNDFTPIFFNYRFGGIWKVN